MSQPLGQTASAAPADSQQTMESADNSTSGTEVDRLREEISRLLAAQAESKHAKDAFLSNTTHELKTPLNAIIGYCDLMLAEVEGPIDNDQYKEYLKAIKEGGEQLSRVVNDLLNVARHESGKVTLNEEYVSVQEMIGAAVRLTQKQGTSIKTEVQPGLPMVYVDERALTQALVNLMDNAIKFSPEGGVITVGAEKSEDDHVVLSVKDTGCGIEEDKLKEITSPFYFTEDVLTRRTKGLGTGLTVVSRIVDLHSAKLSIESRFSVGTIVSISLPPFRNEVVNQSEDETVFFTPPSEDANLKTLLKLDYKGFERIFYAGCGKILIGRNRNTPPLVGCDIIVDDKRVSRPHGTVSHEDGAFIFRDESRSGSHIVCENSDVISLGRGECFKLSGTGKIYLGEHPLQEDAPVVEFQVETEE